jgi:hypothetical protein
MTLTKFLSAYAGAAGAESRKLSTNSSMLGRYYLKNGILKGVAYFKDSHGVLCE